MKIVYMTLMAILLLGCKGMVEDAITKGLNEVIESAEVVEPEEWNAFYTKFQVAIKNNDTAFIEERSYPSSKYEEYMKIITEVRNDETLLNHFTGNEKGGVQDANDPYFTKVEGVENFHSVTFEGGREFLRLTFGQIYGVFVLVDASWYK